VEGLPRWAKEHLIKNQALLEDQHRTFRVPFGYQVPMIINAGDGKNQHPTQCLLDLYTMREVMGDIHGLKIALLNDIAHARTHASLLSVAHHFNWEIHFAYPPRFGPRPQQLEDLVRNKVQFYDHGDDLLGAMRAAQIAYHSRPQKERIKAGEDLVTIKEFGNLTKTKYDSLGKDAPWLMHPLPVDAEEFEEISADLRFHSKNITHLQASNGLHTRIAGLSLGLGRLPWRYEKKSSEKSLFILEDLSLPENRKTEKNLRSGYVEGSGVVLDHIPAGMGRRLAGVLGFEHQRLPQVISDYMPVRDGRKAVKDMIKLHSAYVFSDEQYQAMALIAPEISVSFITEGRIIRKVRPHLGSEITGRIICGNTACVTNVQREHVTCKHHVEPQKEGFALRCHYCETSDTVEKAYQENRFVYVK
ncbi:MAG: aspartate carbamoyltransferase regulatory subunit, partial [Nanoarchaeota archaeon]|nr:aspartate carbamoyltransferase regulatory subunit [Nanoarchaeota archaeon]